GLDESAGSRDGKDVWLHVSVADTGIGIAREKQALIFASFTQADSSTTRKYGGTGLGLAIARQLVELMGGRIRVESELGRGSTFRFTARFGVERDGAAAAPVVRPECVHDLRVLVVDDNATNRRILLEVLTHWGMRPTAVDGGVAGLAVMEEAARAGSPFALVLLDGHMPGLDGFAVAERIVATPALASARLML